jgi:hypothetical protein
MRLSSPHNNLMAARETGDGRIDMPSFIDVEKIQSRNCPGVRYPHPNLAAAWSITPMRPSTKELSFS